MDSLNIRTTIPTKVNRAVESSANDTPFVEAGSSLTVRLNESEIGAYLLNKRKKDIVHLMAD